MAIDNDDAVEAFKDANHGLRLRAPVTMRPEGTCVHCGAECVGATCPRCFDAELTRLAFQRQFNAVACPTCGAQEFFACDGAVLGVHVSRMVLAIKAVRS